jgi:hypothetical protein
MLRPTPSMVVLIVGNLLDGLLTLILLQLRLVCEVNPLLACAYEVSPLTFMIGKLSMVQLSILLASLQPSGEARRIFLRGGAALYGGIVAYQLVLLLNLTLAG